MGWGREESAHFPTTKSRPSSNLKQAPCADKQTESEPPFRDFIYLETPAENLLRQPFELIGSRPPQPRSCQLIRWETRPAPSVGSHPISTSRHESRNAEHESTISRSLFSDDRAAAQSVTTPNNPDLDLDFPPLPPTRWQTKVRLPSQRLIAAAGSDVKLGVQYPSTSAA